MEFLKKLSLLLVMCFTVALFFHSIAYGFDGEFSLDISMEPQTNTSEAALIDFDLESNIKLGIDLSGLSLSSDIGFGIAGIEFSIFGIGTTLGPLDLSDDFIFAAPFNKNGLVLDSLMFVKKRVKVETNLAGLKVIDLVLYEDVTFPDPSSSLQTQAYSADDQTFKFGNILSVEGETVSGIKVTSILGACANPQKYNRIKKREFRSKVCKHEGLEGFIEKVIIEAIQLANTNWESETVFTVLEPVEETITGKVNLFDLVNLELELITTDITTLDFENYTFKVASDWITFLSEWRSEFEETWYWVDIPLSYGGLDLDYQVAFIEDEGLTDMLLEGTIDITPSSRLGIIAVYSDGPPVELDTIQFNLKSKVHDLDMEGQALFTAQAFKEANFGIGIEF